MDLIVRRSALSLLFTLGLVFLIGPGSASAQTRKKIAIYPFDDSLARTQVKIGEKVADALISKLAGNSNFEIVDREYLNRIVAEQNLKMDARFDPAGAARIGKLANVDIVVTGRVDAFQADTSTETASGVFTVTTKLNGEIALKVTARLISVETASILGAPEASAELKEILAQKKDVMQSNQGSVASNTWGGNAQTALLKLVDKGVAGVSADLAKQIEARLATVIPRSAVAKVIGMQGDFVLINRGTTAGVKVGDRFSVIRRIDTGLKDPDTGQPVSRKKKICSITVTEVDDSMSTAKFDGEQPLAGDQAEPVQN